MKIQDLYLSDLLAGVPGDILCEILDHPSVSRFFCLLERLIEVSTRIKTKEKESGDLVLSFVKKTEWAHLDDEVTHKWYSYDIWFKDLNHESKEKIFEVLDQSEQTILLYWAFEDKLYKSENDIIE